MAHDADAAERERIAQVLAEWANRDPAAQDRLVPLVYQKAPARPHYTRNEREGQTLQTAALVNELYLRLAGSDHLGWRDRAHFLRDGGDADATRPRGLRRSARATSVVPGLSVTSLDDNVIARSARLMSSRSTKRSTRLARQARREQPVRQCLRAG